MKQFYKSLGTMFVFIIVSTFWTGAFAVEIDGIYYALDQSNNTATVTNKSQSTTSFRESYYTNAYSGAVTIPSIVTYEGKSYTVTTIQACAFNDCTELININIPATVTNINAASSALYPTTSIDGFPTCPSLKAIVVDSDNKYYSTMGGVLFNKDKRVLYYCPRGKTGNYNIPSTVTSIFQYAFLFCENITTVSIPDCVTFIGPSAFEGCKALTSVNIPTNLKTLGGRAFYNDYSLSSIMTFPIGVKNITKSAFYDCSALTTIELPEGLVQIEDFAFSGCSNLSNIILPSTLKGLGMYSFSGCKNLKSIIIPNEVTEIPQNAFWISGLTSVTLPETLVKIGRSAFYSNYLSTIKIPKSIKSIDDNAFPQNVNYDVYVYNHPSAITIAKGTFGNNLKRVTIHVYKPFVEAFQNTGNWKEYANCIVGDIPVDPVTNITFDQASIVMNTNTEGKLTATVKPDDATIKGVTFTSSNENVVIILDDTGKFLTLDAGTATITATATDGSGVKATCKVTVTENIKVESVILNKKETSIKAGSTQTLTATINPSNATIKNVTWKSSNPKVATVDENGVVTGISAGTVTITATATDGSGVNATCKVTVTEEIKVASVTLNKKEFTIKAGSTQTLTATINPSNATMKSVTWQSSNPKVATVDENGVVTGISAGTATITAIATDGSGVKGTCKVTVTEEIKVESVTLNKKEVTIKAGSTQTLTATINPSNATMKSVTWQSSNPKVATVDENGVVTGISTGTATITAIATDGSGVKATCKVTIIYNSIALNDASTSYSNNTETTVNPLEYTRIFNNTDWQALYIPFSMSYDDWKDYFDIARIDGIRLIDKNNDGIINETILDIVKIEEGTITANTPYLIKPKETGEKTISISNTILYKSEENGLNFTTNNATFTFIGNYSTISASTLITNNYYTMDGGSLIITNGSNGLQPFRWYLKVESQGSAYNTTMPIAINVIGEENASTGIEESLIMNDKQHIYDLNGRVVNEKSLKSGIYIRNGKKVIIR